MQLAPLLPVTMTLLLAATAPSGATPTSRQFRDADNNYKFAARALQAGNVRKAAEYYGKALKILPNFPEAHIGMGHIAMGEGRYEDALTEYERACSGYADVSDSLFHLEVSRYMKAQDEIIELRGEIQRFQQLLAGRSNVNSAQVERSIREMEVAVQRLELVRLPTKQTLREPPGELYFYLGNAHFHLNHLDDAIVAWETCVRKSPKFPIVYNNLAVAYLKKDRVEESRRSLARAEQMGVVVNPDLRAEIERSAGKPPEAAGHPNGSP